jgi:hypothetical protein
MAADESVTVKGSPVRSLQKFIDASLTPAQRESVLSTLPEPWRQRLHGPILPTETVPVTILNRLTEEAAHALGEPLEQFARRAGREGASDAVKGIYRFFALVLTPAALLSKASQMWTSLYNRGELKVTNQTEHSAVLQLCGIVMEPAGCARMTGWVERMAEMTNTGGNLKLVKSKCSAKGDPCCEWQLEWS